MNLTMLSRVAAMYAPCSSFLGSRLKVEGTATRGAGLLRLDAEPLEAAARGCAWRRCWSCSRASPRGAAGG